MNENETRIAVALNGLIGQPLSASGRAADMETFAFGRITERVTSSGQMRPTTQFALHVQCSWRIIRQQELVVGYRDILYENEQGHEHVRAQKMAALLDEFRDPPLIVESIDVDGTGAARIHLSHGYSLELFPDSTGTTIDVPEYWRLLIRIGDRKRHFVVSAKGIDERRPH